MRNFIASFRSYIHSNRVLGSHHKSRSRLAQRQLSEWLNSCETSSLRLRENGFHCLTALCNLMPKGIFQRFHQLSLAWSRSCLCSRPLFAGVHQNLETFHINTHLMYRITSSLLVGLMRHLLFLFCNNI